MASERGLSLLTIVLLGSISSCRGQNEQMIDAVNYTFLSKPLNGSESEEILKSARESFLFLKGVEKRLGEDEKSSFAKNYGNFLSRLLEQLKTKDVEVRELFSKENSFLRGYKENGTVENVNVTKIQVAVESFQIAAERLLVPYYNSSKELYDAAEILNMKNLSFDDFLKKKLRADYSEIGYFLLEVFATLIGLSWGIVSTVLHVAESMGMIA